LALAEEKQLEQVDRISAPVAEETLGIVGTRN